MKRKKTETKNGLISFLKKLDDLIYKFGDKIL